MYASHFQESHEKGQAYWYIALDIKHNEVRETQLIKPQLNPALKTNTNYKRAIQYNKQNSQQFPFFTKVNVKATFDQFVVFNVNGKCVK